jgi:CheY-like chemotaxis protein
LINSLVHSLAPLAHEKGIELNCYIDETFPHQVFSDAQRLRQLLSNLIRHAIDNCQSGEVRIHGYARAADIEGRVTSCMEIDFRPQPGSEKLSTDQLPSSDDALALRVGWQLTRLMGGHFNIQYPSENKIRFVLDFSWKPDEQSVPPQPISFDQRRILIFEPDETSRGNLEKQLQQLGIKTYATDGNDSLIAHILWSKEKNALFDAIILCESLKSSSTRELIKRIRNEAQCQAPILYATYLHNIERADPGTMNDVQVSMLKPFSQEVLADTLKKLFDQTENPTVPEQDGCKQYRILLAEDSEINASIIYSHLSDMGHDVDVATDGNTALYAMHKHHYDIVFMDIHMPNMDGIEATRKWRRIEPGQKMLPVIAITAKATSEDKNLCFEAGMNGFLTKPVNAMQLAEILDSYL